MSNLLQSFCARFNRVDAAMVHFMSEYGPRLLRYSLAVVFIWFGALKISGYSPVTDLVARTVYWLPADRFILILGIWEVLVGVGLLFRFVLRLTLLLFWLLLVGTSLVLVLRPDIAFQDGNPLLLTMEGEFVVKNLVLIAAGLVVGSRVR